MLLKSTSVPAPAIDGSSRSTAKKSADRCSRCRHRVYSRNTSRYFSRSPSMLALRRPSISINTALSTVLLPLRDGQPLSGPDPHQHHQIVKPLFGPATQPTHSPLIEPGTQRHRSAKAKVFRFYLHTGSCSFSLHTFMPLCGRNGKSEGKANAEIGTTCLASTLGVGIVVGIRTILSGVRHSKTFRQDIGRTAETYRACVSGSEKTTRTVNRKAPSSKPGW
jgi:hypothetical protein